MGIKVNLGIFGGTFDPIHIGHIEVANHAASELELDTVIFVPAGCPQLKNNSPEATPLQRFDMVKLAIDNQKMFQVSDIEIKRKGPTFTVETLAKIKENLNFKASLWFIVGADAFSEFNRWENYEKILKLSKICVVTRPGTNEQSENLNELITENKIMFVDWNTPRISSSQVKKIMKDKLEVTKLLHPKVYDYIVKNDLYGNIKDK